MCYKNEQISICVDTVREKGLHCSRKDIQIWNKNKWSLPEWIEIGGNNMNYGF